MTVTNVSTLRHKLSQIIIGVENGNHYQVKQNGKIVMTINPPEQTKTIIPRLTIPSQYKSQAYDRQAKDITVKTISTSNTVSRARLGFNARQRLQKYIQNLPN